MSEKKIIKNFTIKSSKNLNPLKNKDGWYYGIYKNYHEFRECIDFIEDYFSSDKNNDSENRAKWAVKKLANYFNLQIKEKNEDICCDDNSKTS